MTNPKHVIDTNGTRYELVRQLGSGGQGTVFEVKGGRLAVKLLNRADAADSRRVQRHFEFLKHLDVGNVPIAKPISVLRTPYAGYVMPLLIGMEPVNNIMRPPAHCASILKWYRETGSIKRRLECLAAAADAIAALHARGLCYGDVSSANIFIPESIDESDVSLIDADNLRYASGIPPHGFFTPGFGAPEIVTRTGTVSSLSDAYSFAVLVFHTLAQNHPLLGDAVHDGEPEMEERAFAGELPWIDHASNAMNRSSRGIPRQFALSKGLQALAGRAFTEGLLQAIDRPTVSAWADALRRAADQCLRCLRCENWLYRGEARCPWCDASAPSFVYARVFTELKERGKLRLGPDKKEAVEGSMIVCLGTSAKVRAGLAHGLAAADRRAPLLMLNYDKSAINLKRLDADAVIEVEQGTQSGTLRGELSVPDSKATSLRLYFGTRGSERRVMHFSVEAGARS